eukprot:2741778-Prymnesium_polylepis.1
MLKGGVSRSPPGLPPPARHRSTPQRCAGPRLERTDEHARRYSVVVDDSTVSNRLIDAEGRRQQVTA